MKRLAIYIIIVVLGCLAASPLSARPHRNHAPKSPYHAHRKPHHARRTFQSTSALLDNTTPPDPFHPLYEHRFTQSDSLIFGLQLISADAWGNRQNVHTSQLRFGTGICLRDSLWVSTDLPIHREIVTAFPRPTFGVPRRIIGDGLIPGEPTNAPVGDMPLWIVLLLFAPYIHHIYRKTKA